MLKKGQVIVLVIWVLILLTFLAVGVANRVSMALKLARYEMDSIRSIYLAKAGVNRAIAVINKDPDAYDSLEDDWAANEDFEKITVGEDTDNFSTVNFFYWDGGKRGEKFGCVDEERKININKAQKVVLVKILETFLGGENTVSADELANNIIAWRENSSTAAGLSKETDYTGMGYICKGAPFTNTAELALVKGFTPLLCRKLKGVVTVYGGGGVNVNTCDPEVLKILIDSYVLVNSSPTSEEINKNILDYRQNNKFLLQSVLDGFVLNTAIPKYLLVVQSHNFRIISSGKLKNSKVIRRIECVYSREPYRKNVFYYEY